MNNTRSFLWWTLTAVSVSIALYGFAYLILRDRLFPGALAESLAARPWGIYPHALFGGSALLLGPFQFHRRVQQNSAMHRRLGTIYVIAALLAGAAGLYMAVYSYGGLPTHLGFGILGAATLFATATAFRYAKAGAYAKHREWMIRSFALIFAAPTQRLWLGALLGLTRGDFDVAYLWSSWLCWAINLIVAEWIIVRTRQEPLRFGGVRLSAPAVHEPAASLLP